MFVVRKKVVQEAAGPGVKYLPQVSKARAPEVGDGSALDEAGPAVDTSQCGTSQRGGRACREWNPSKRWNLFNSYKLLAQVERWKKIKRGRAIPPPVLITVDPTNICNLNCAWCSAELDDEGFGVYGVTHKFNSQFAIANYFSRCHSIFMTAFTEPPTGEDAPNDSFTVGLCCDRRGDEKLELARNIEQADEIDRLWGSGTHWRIHDAIKVHSECPRCTYQPHNEIYEQVVLNDSMTYKFI